MYGQTGLKEFNAYWGFVRDKVAMAIGDRSASVKLNRLYEVCSDRVRVRVCSDNIYNIFVSV